MGFMEKEKLMKNHKSDNGNGTFAEFYVLEAYASFHEATEKIDKAFTLLGGTEYIYFDDTGQLHSRFSDGTLTADEREQLITLIGESWEIINRFLAKIE